MLVVGMPGASHSLLLCAFVLVHFMWQGAVLAGLLAIVLPFTRQSSANTRYLFAVSILTVMAFCPLVTAAVLSGIPNRNGSMAPDAAGQVRSAQVGAVSLLHRDNGSAAQQLRAVSESTLSGMAGALHRNSKQIVLAWLIGVAVLAIRGLVGWLSLRRLMKQDRSSPGPTSRLTDLARKMHIGRMPELRVSNSAPSAFVFGALRAVIVIPTGAILGLSPQMLDTILAHELAHVRRHDYLVNLAQCLVETLLFYHPAVWWVSHQIREEREICCDDMVIATTNDRISYAQALEGLEQLRGERMAVAANGGALLNRIQRILETGALSMNSNMELHGRNRCQLAVGTCAVALGICMLIGIRGSSAHTVKGALNVGQTGLDASAQPALPGKGSSNDKARKQVAGPGITITLTDSMLPAPAGHPRNEALILDTDLQQLVHELRAADAREIYIGEQRVDHDTHIRAWGNNITVDGFGMGRPFVVRALGDPKSLQRAVEAEDGVVVRLRHIDPAMVAIETSDHVNLPVPSADRPKAAYIIQVRILHCEVSSDGTVTEKVQSTPAASTFAGSPASFTMSSASGAGETLTFNPNSAPRHRIQLTAAYSKTELHRAPMRASTPPGFTVERDKNVRILGVVSTGDKELRSAVERGKVVHNRGAYEAYYVEVKVE